MCMNDLLDYCSLNESKSDLNDELNFFKDHTKSLGHFSLHKQISFLQTKTVKLMKLTEV